MHLDERTNKDNLEKILNEYMGDANRADYEMVRLVRSGMTRRSDIAIRPKALFYLCSSLLLVNRKIPEENYCAALTYGLDIYKEIFPYGEQTKDFDERAEAFAEMFEGNGFVARQCFDIKIFNLFYNVSNYTKWMKSMKLYPRFSDNVGLCLNYGQDVRSYFPDEEAFTSNFIMVCSLMMDAGDPKAVYLEQKRKIEHMVGIYAVDESLIREAEISMSAAKDTIDRSKDILNLLEERMHSINDSTEHAAERIKQIATSEVDLAQARISGIEDKLQRAYDNFLDTQRERVIFEKKQLVDDVVRESENKLAEFRENVRSILNMAKLEISDMNQKSGEVLTKLNAYINDDKKIKELLKTSAEQEKILNKLEKLTILNDNNMELLNTRLEQEARVLAEQKAEEEARKAAEEERLKKLQDSGNGKKSAGQKDNGAENNGGRKNQAGGKNSYESPNVQKTVVQTYSVQNEGDNYRPEPVDSEEIPEVNPVLDCNIDFQTRYQTVMKRKAEMEKKGEHFHKMFNDVLIAVMENANPYLIGPSGCGKTYMVGQICKLLDTSFIDIGYINEEYDILGFQTANGGYSRPNFYRCYKYGKIAFCDELDNGNSRATVKLNSFLSNTKGAGYNFPNGEHVKRHGNFRIIAAGNTAGNGADSVYNTREKIEESVQQRFVPIYVGYDNEIERAILKNYPEWFDFVVLFRNATNGWSKKSHCVASGIITTRDTARIRQYLDNKSFDMNRILDYEFIQTKDEGYLAFLAEYVKQNVQGKSPCKEIAYAFIKKVDAIRRGETERY